MVNEMIEPIYESVKGMFIELIYCYLPVGKNISEMANIPSSSGKPVEVGKTAYKAEYSL